MASEHHRRPKLWFVLFPLLLVLALVIWMRTLPTGAPEDAAAIQSMPTEAPPDVSVPPETETSPEPEPKPEESQNPPETEKPAEAGPLSYTKESYQIVSDLVYTYAVKQREGTEEIDAALARLRDEDPRLGSLWEKIMRYWDFVNEDMPELSSAVPDGLPEDESLCIVVLGFQLHADGSMAEELTGRCETALALAEAYPEARLALTGGGTAWQNRTVTEAGAMAQWFLENGVAEDRILTEDRSLTTADNAVFTCGILRREAPQVRTLVLVTSDYHMPLGALLFEEEALLLEAEEGEKPFSVEAFAAYDTQNRYSPDTPMQQKAYVWSIADPKY